MLSRKRILTPTIVLSIYIIAMLFLIPKFGLSMGILSIAPVAIIANVMGRVSGVSAGLIVFGFNLALFAYFGFDLIVWMQSGGLLGSLMVLITGAIIGTFSEVRARLLILVAEQAQHIDNSPLGIQIFQSDGTLTRVNSAWEIMWAVNANDVVGKYNALQDPNLESLGLLSTLKRIFAGELIQIPDTKYDPAAAGLPGRVRWIKSSAYYTTNHLDDSQNVVLVSEDMTETRQYEAELLNTQKLESLGQIAGGIAHDFNNALAEILMNAEVGLVMKGLDEKTKKIFLSIKKSIQNTMGITKQLVTYSKGGEPVKVPTNIGNLLKESVDFSLSGTSINAEVNVSKNLDSAIVDKGQISQVVSNLVINARQATDLSGQIIISAENVTIDSSSSIGNLGSGDYIKIIVSDSGIGIEESNLEKIFDPFYTSKSEGAGLGLFSCFQIINNHGGWIGAESDLGQGSTFTFYLPSADVLLEEDTSELEHVGVGNILIMDDNEVFRSMLIELLTSFGYSAKGTAEGGTAIELYKTALNSESSYDLCILDLTIPNGMGGKETAKRLLHINPNAKLVVTSGYSEDAVMSSFEDFGFVAALPKPFNRKDLATVLDNVLS